MIGPAFVTINEVCRWQVQEVNIGLRDAGYIYHWRHDSTQSIPDSPWCEKGNAVMWHNSRSSDAVSAYGWGVGGVTSGSDHRRMVCASLEVSVPRLRLCATHLSNGLDQDAYTRRTAQMFNVANLTRLQLQEGYQIITGGDFNQVPVDPQRYGGRDQMDPMYPTSYQPAGTGITTEVSGWRGGFPTQNVVQKKYDYIFLTSAFSPASAVVQPGHPS